MAKADGAIDDDHILGEIGEVSVRHISLSFSRPFLREVFIAGRFALPDGMLRNVAKIGEDGRLDRSFDPGLGASFGSTVGVILPQDGGQILAGGDFDSMHTTHRMGVVRINGDGTVDPSFNARLE